MAPVAPPPISGTILNTEKRATFRVGPGLGSWCLSLLVVCALQGPQHLRALPSSGIHFLVAPRGVLRLGRTRHVPGATEQHELQPSIPGPFVLTSEPQDRKHFKDRDRAFGLYLQCLDIVPSPRDNHDEHRHPPSRSNLLSSCGEGWLQPL